MREVDARSGCALCLLTEPGDVLMPFAGSGSECRVAQSMGHRYLGIELDEQWVRLARETLPHYGTAACCNVV